MAAALSNEDASTGVLCSSCTDLVGDLFRLQHELRGVKNDIVNTFKNALKTETKEETATEAVPMIEVEKKMEVDDADVKTPAKEKVKKKKPSEKKKPVKEEEVYIIELLKEKKGNKFLVKWENFPDEESTWEPKSSIPEYILEVMTVDYYIIMMQTKWFIFLENCIEKISNKSIFSFMRLTQAGWGLQHLLPFLW